MKSYCVYKHTCPNGKVYIGITSQSPERRWENGNHYKTQLFNRAIKKFGWENIKHEIIARGLSEDAACIFERSMIEIYKATDPQFGYNISAGGTFGNTLSDEGRKRIADYHKKAVNQYSKSGELIASYPSAKEASKATGINRGHISEACKGHRQLKTAGGYVWRYAEDPFVPLVYERAGKAPRKVAQYTKDGEFIREFESIGEARRETGARHIRRVLNGENETSGGYVWKEVT